MSIPTPFEMLQDAPETSQKARATQHEAVDAPQGSLDAQEGSLDAQEGSLDAQEAVPAPLNRMAIAIIALAGVFLSGYMLLYKLGLIGELTCGAGSCDRVQASQWADFLGVPVPLWGVLGYVLIFGLAVAALQAPLLRNRRVAAALLATTGVAFGFSLYLTYLEAFVIHAWCRWCIASAIMATTLFVLALPELPRTRRQTSDG